MKKNMFILYSWATVILWFGLIYLFSTFESFEPDGSYQHWIITSIGYELAYALQFLLIFRVIIDVFEAKSGEVDVLEIKKGEERRCRIRQNN